MKNIIVSIILLSIIISCKKKKDSPEDPGSAPGTTTGTTTGSTTGGSNVTPTVTTMFSGFLSTGNYTYIQSTTGTLTSVNATAYFSSVPTAFTNTASTVKVAGVLMNGDSLKFEDFINYYMQAPGQAVSMASQSWSVTGANGIPSFAYNNANAFPTSSNLNIVPDSISKSAGLTLTINNVANITQANVILFNMNSGGLPVVKQLVTGNNTITFSQSNLSSFSTGADAAMIGIAMENSQAMNISGKNFKFSKEVSYTKVVKVKP